MIEVVMPQMGESIVEGTVVRWLKQIGESVQRDEPLLEISTDKVDAEVPAPAPGVLAEIRVSEGDTVAVSTVLGLLREPGATDEHASQPAANEPPDEPPPPAPKAAPGPPPPPPPPPPAPATSPATAPLETERDADGGDDEDEDDESDLESEIEARRRQRSSPVVRRIAADHQVDIASVPGTGIGGRVTKRDILSHIGAGAPGAEGSISAPTTPTTPPGPAPAPGPTSDESPAPASPTRPGAPRVERMSPIRRRTAEHMVQSRRTAAHATTLFEMDMTRIEKLKAAYKRTYYERGVALTYLPFIVKAAVDALKAHPGLNASVEGDSILYHPSVNVGIAVAADHGLVVPVIRNAEEKNVLGIATAIADLADRARTKRLRVEDLQGGTFTVTNPGVFGSLFGTPIIHQPQVAILAIGVIEKRPVVRDDAIAIRTMAYFALSFDHRVIDGADADRFMGHIKRTLQELDESAL